MNKTGSDRRNGWRRGPARHLYRPLLLCLLLLPADAAEATGGAAVSRPGEYAGYSQPIYSEWVRTSQYITVRDGTKLAADIFRPARDGRPDTAPLPVVWTFDRYHRADVQGGILTTELQAEPWLSTLLRRGYVIGVVDVRGSGASFGTWEGFTEREAADGYDVTEWFAAQPWCNQRVGMFGRSYLGITQYMTAATKPPHLRAIFPEMAVFDLYSFAYAGGVFKSDFAAHWDRLVKQLDLAQPAAPVAEDARGEMLAAALRMHKGNMSVEELLALTPYRDSVHPKTGVRPYSALNPAARAAQVSESGVAVYHMSGWFDMWPRDALLWFSNLKNPQKIIIGPWAHTTNGEFDLGAEHLRWYDYWLKGIDNGVMNEPPVYFYTMNAPPGREWRAERSWPPPGEQPTSYYFRAASGPGKGAALDPQPPSDESGQDDYTVDYTTTSGATSRWTNGYGGKFGYADLTANDAKGLTYTTAPLAADLEVTGHPVAHLWLSTRAKDADLFVYLEEETPGGKSRYVTEGTLRASHRRLAEPGFNNLGLPFHRGLKADTEELSGEPAELVLDLLPTSTRFPAGSRIRVTITGADRDNSLTPEQSPPPVISILRNSAHASYVVLPIVPVAPQEAGGAQSAAPAEKGRVWPRVAAVAGATMLLLTLLYVRFQRKARAA
jgi:uncharacterized protein